MSAAGNRRTPRRHRCASLCENNDHNHERQPLMGYASQRYGTDGQGVDDLTSSGQHCHDKSTERARMDRKAMRKLIIASVLCILFIIVEVVGGFLANSLAIATDAAHMLTDFFSFMISLFSLVIASRAPTKSMSFGWYRAEVMGALVSVLLIWVVTGILVYLAILRVISDDYEIDATVMLITSAAGVTFNIIMGACLHGVGHGHSHGGGGGGGHGHSHGGGGHSHGEHGGQRGRAGSLNNAEPDLITSECTKCSEEKGSPVVPIDGGESGEHQNLLERDLSSSQRSHTQEEKENINVRAAFIHVLGDFVQSIGVLIASYIIYYKPEWKLADPICTFLFSILVIFTTITILKDAVMVLMEGKPTDLSFKEVKSALNVIPGVQEVHNLRIWSLSVNKCALAVHLAVDQKHNPQLVLATASRIMRDDFGIIECTVQIENYVQDMDDCEQCQDPQD